MVDLQTDERWQLVQRLCQPAFSEEHPTPRLVQYIVEQTLHGNAHELTGSTLGTRCFSQAIRLQPAGRQLGSGPRAAVASETPRVLNETAARTDHSGNTEGLVRAGPFERLRKPRQSHPQSSRGQFQLCLAAPAMLPGFSAGFWRCCRRLGISESSRTRSTAAIAGSSRPFLPFSPDLRYAASKHHRRGGQHYGMARIFPASPDRWTNTFHGNSSGSGSQQNWRGEFR